VETAPRTEYTSPDIAVEVLRRSPGAGQGLNLESGCKTRAGARNCRLRVMQSSGGLIAPGNCSAPKGTTILSGPPVAGGRVKAGAHSGPTGSFGIRTSVAETDPNANMIVFSQ